MSQGLQTDTILQDEREPLSFDEAVRRALAFCDTLPEEFAPCRAQLAELQTRLSKGRLHFAVLGQFNRGKSTFINALLGIKALPASVLPLTSVPTIIEYGAELCCRIRFLDGRGDIVIDESGEAMEAALRQYVAEENNPKNKFQVKDATVACPSGLLSNGTVLIDTPGFGSTHLHNTQTTLDLLIECDAALFLLSADPPMTQTELEFLRMVKERVPKLFFILNKCDLLDAAEIDEIDRFVKSLLTRKLGFPADTPLYRTCAVKGLRAEAADAKDKNWSESGLEAVKKDIIDFMAHEKYFTLSEALSEKYDEAACAVKSLLEEKLNGILAPLTAAQKEIAAVVSAIQSLSLELESEQKRVRAEKEALDAAITAIIVKNTAAYKVSIDKALGLLLDNKYIPVEAASIASAMLPRHARDLGEKMLREMTEAVNRSIRIIAISHAAAFANQQKRYGEQLGDKVKPIAAEDLIARLEIGAAGKDTLFDDESFPIPPPQITDIFKKRSARFEAIRAFYEPLCAERVADNIRRAESTAKTAADEAWERMRETARRAYTEAIGVMKEIWNVKQDKLDADEAAAKGEIEFLRGRIKEFGAATVR